ncbi:MAG: hypothetical protein V2A53_09460 [bacterium]
MAVITDILLDNLFIANEMNAREYSLCPIDYPSKVHCGIYLYSYIQGKMELSEEKKRLAIRFTRDFCGSIEGRDSMILL